MGMWLLIPAEIKFKPYYQKGATEKTASQIKTWLRTPKFKLLIKFMMKICFLCRQNVNNHFVDYAD